MPDPDKRTTVVICAWTLARWERLLAAVDSVVVQEPAPDEVAVVIDHNPELLRRASAAIAPQVRVIASDGPPGLSGARNTGVRATTGDVVIFLDDDARARPGWLAELLAAYGPNTIGVGGAAIPDWETGRPGWFPEEFDWVVGCSYRGQPTALAEVRNPIGANMSFARDALRAAGAFDARLGRVASRPVGAEETEVSIRARRAIPGGRILLAPAAIVDHHVPSDRATLRYFLARCHGEGRSKAALVELAGHDRALASERTYVLRTLPNAFARNLISVVRGDLDAGRRAVAIVLGLAATAVGFVAGRLRLRGSSLPETGS